MSSVRQAVAALSDEQRRILRERSAQGERPALEWLSALTPLLAVDDAMNEALIRSGRRQTIAWSVPLISWIVAAVAAVAGAEELALAVGVLIAVSIVVAVVLTIGEGRLRRRTLPSAPLRLVLALLPLLAEDADPGTSLALGLDLGGHRAKVKAVGRSAPYKRGRYHKIVDRTYADPCVAMRVRFADGARVVLAALVVTTVQKKTKRNPRGKIKTKTKIKSRVTYEATVRFPARNYELATATATATGAGADRERIRQEDDRTAVRERRVVKSVGPDPALDPGHLIGLLASAYDRVGPSRRKKLR